MISQSFWRGHALEPKTRHSKAPVSIIRQLAQRLDLHRSLSGNSVHGLMFPSPAGKPINLDALAADVIAPLISKAGIEWHGWHAFRRGLATNLHRLVVQDKIIQRILRQANVAVTQSCYIKTPDGKSFGRCSNLSDFWNMHPNMHLSGNEREQVM